MSETTAGTYATTQMIRVDATPREKRTGGALNASVFVDEDGTIRVVPNDATAAYVMRSNKLNFRLGFESTMNGAEADGTGLIERSRFGALVLTPYREPTLSGHREGSERRLTPEQYAKCKAALDESTTPKGRKRNVRRK